MCPSNIQHLLIINAQGKVDRWLGHEWKGSDVRVCGGDKKGRLLTFLYTHTYTNTGQQPCSCPLEKPLFAQFLGLLMVACYCPEFTHLTLSLLPRTPSLPTLALVRKKKERPKES